MGSSVRFACTSLLGVNKVGTIKQDADGYYPLVVGALGMFNSAGEFYEAEEAKAIFTGSSQFMRRVQRGALRGEYGHPRPEQGQSERAFAARCLDIDVLKACCHHKSIDLDFDNVKDQNGKAVIAIISKVYPSGPFGPFLEKSLKNPGENVCFSIRAFTDDRMVNGINNRILRNVITFDYVNEPGMKPAEKYFSPALEGMNNMIVTKTMLEDGLRERARSGLSMESVGISAQELFTAMKWNADTSKKPAWTDWK